ncbi:EamA family transporter [Alkalicoccus urumqiensis]|uniref:EamA family transporter n=1 Tax=Alkalicoccus urumqiensis TaxID=1548213 RepID=A0A2P6MJY2_ALKUR|nr:DMT family transporter [Alkalicoccus urumqiensis]PRO66606.1 EamA family transporter [Alkalicoccus urumqiensis]
MADRTWPGLLLVLTGTICWGVGGTVSQYLFQEADVPVTWLVSVRLLLSGAGLLFLAWMFRGRAAVVRVVRDRRALGSLILFGIFGMLGVQYTYMASISEGNAAVATLLQYSAPVFIIAWVLLRQPAEVTKREGTAVMMALSGTFLLLTNGSVSALSVPVPAVLWGLLSGAALAFYTLYAGPLLREWGSMTVIGWAMLIGGAAVAFLHPPWQIDTSAWTLTVLAYFLFVVFFGTMLAFWFYLESLRFLKPQVTSVLGSMEPLSAVVTSIVWLQIAFGGWQMLGGALILGMTFYLTLGKPPEKAGQEEETA